MFSTVGEQNLLAIVGQIGGQERAPLPFRSLPVAHAVKRHGDRVPRTAAERLAGQSRGCSHHGVFQHVAHLRIGSERIGQDVEPAARRGRHAVVLIAHVVVQSPMPLDEQDLAEIQQRIGEGDRRRTRQASANNVRRASRSAGSTCWLRVLQLSQFLGRRDRSWLVDGSGRKCVEQGGCAAQHDVGRIAILVQDQRLAAIRRGGDLLKVSAIVERCFQFGDTGAHSAGI